MPSTTQPSYDQVFKSTVTEISHLKAVDTLYYAADNITLYENEQSSPFRRKRDMVMIFNLKGSLTSHFGGIKTPHHYTTKTWSLTYAPHDNIHPAPGAQWMETFALGINKSFFHELLLHEKDPWLEKMLTRIEKGEAFDMVPNDTVIAPSVELLLQQFRNTTHTGGLKTLYQQSRLHEMLLLQLAHIKSLEQAAHTHARVMSNDRQQLQELKLYLEHHFLEEFTLDGLAKLSQLNTFKLKTGFRQMFGTSVFEYIRMLRMQYAQQQLKDGGTSISAIAYDLGYQHIQHFSAAFKKYHGHSPKHFRTCSN